MAPLAFVDCETTGLDPDRHQVWEVGLVLADSDELDNVDEHVWHLPVHLRRADPMALRISGFRQRHGVRDEVINLDVFAPQLAQLTDGAHLVGAVPSFDEERLRRILRAHGECPTWHYHLIDIEAMAVGWLHARGENRPPVDLSLPWESNELSRACGIEPPSDDERHTALGDARWAYRWYRALVGGER